MFETFDERPKSLVFCFHLIGSRELKVSTLPISYGHIRF